MRLLALDHGAARCGCAVCDPTETIVRPLASIGKPDSPAGLDAIADLADEQEAELVIVGLPLLAGGEEGAQAAAARAFAGRLGAKLSVGIELFDERYTTRMAQASAAAGATADEDSLAAAHLLEEFIARRGESKVNDE